MPIAPVAFNYADTDDPDLPKFDLVVAGRVGATVRPFYKRLVDEGRRVIQYVNFTDVNGPNYSALDETFQRTSHALPYSNWSGYRIGDLRQAAFRDHLIREAFPRALSHPAITDVFVDVMGLRLWTTAWDQMKAAGVAADWTKGMEEMGDRVAELRDRIRPGARIWANGTWPLGHPGLCPVVEHHPVGEIPFWRGYLDPIKWDSSGQPSGLIIGWSMGEWDAWRAVPGVGCFGAQGTYTYAPSQAIPYAKMLPRTAAPAPAPVPPPSTTLPRPAAPVAPVIAPGDATVTIARPTFTDAEQVTTWQVYVNDSTGPPSRLDLAAVGGDAIDELTLDAPNGVPRTYRVGGRNLAGYGPWSPSVTVEAKAPPAPEPPPPDPTAEALRAELEAARAELARVRAAVATRVGQFTADIAADLEG